MITLKDDEVKINNGEIYYIKDGRLIKVFPKKMKKIKLHKAEFGGYDDRTYKSELCNLSKEIISL